MVKRGITPGMNIIYNGTKYVVVGVHKLYIEISAIGFTSVFKIGNEHIQFFTI